MPATIQKDATKPTFLERWVSGTYLVSGIFPTECNSLTIEQIVARIPSFYSITKSGKLAKWPRGICGYYLIPIYISNSFDDATIKWVHSYHAYRWAIWHEPVLYCSLNNTAHFRNDYGLCGQAFRIYLANTISAALSTVSSRFNFGFPEMINGKKIERAAS